MAHPPASGPQMLTANCLRQGAVVYWKSGGWVLEFADGEVFTDPATANAALAAADKFVTGNRVVAPYLEMELRAKIDQASSIIMLGVFFLLWYVPVVNNLFWSVVSWISVQLQIPLSLAVTGLNQFQFWRR